MKSANLRPPGLLRRRIPSGNLHELDRLVVSSPGGYKKSQWAVNVDGPFLTFSASKSAAQAYSLSTSQALQWPYQNDEGQTLIGVASGQTPAVAQKVKYHGTPRDTVFYDEEGDPYPVAKCSLSSTTCYLKCAVTVDHYLYNSLYIDQNPNAINNLAFGSTKGNNTLYVGPVQLKAFPAS